MREDFFTKWKAVFTPLTAVPLAGTVCSSGTTRRRSLQRAHLKKAELELEEAVKIFTSRREMCTVNSRESDSRKHCELAVLTDCKDVNYEPR